MLLALDAKSSKTLFTKKKLIKRSKHRSRILMAMKTFLRLFMVGFGFQMTFNCNVPLKRRVINVLTLPS